MEGKQRSRAKDGDDATINNQLPALERNKLRTPLGVRFKVCIKRSKVVTQIDSGSSPNMEKNDSPIKPRKVQSLLRRRIPSRADGGFSFDFPLDIDLPAHIYRTAHTCRPIQNTLQPHPWGTMTFQTRPCETQQGFARRDGKRRRGSFS